MRRKRSSSRSTTRSVHSRRFGPLRSAGAGGSVVAFPHESQDPATPHAIDRDSRVVYRSSEGESVHEAGIELRHTGARSRVRFILVEESAHRVDQELPFDSNQSSECRDFVLGQRLRSLVRRLHREAEKFRRMPIDFVFPFAHASGLVELNEDSTHKPLLILPVRPGDVISLAVDWMEKVSDEQYGE